MADARRELGKLSAEEDVILERLVRAKSKDERKAILHEVERLRRLYSSAWKRYDELTHELYKALEDATPEGSE